VKYGSSSDGYILLGAEARDGESYASVWVETAPRSTALRGELIALADAADPPLAWERKFSEWGGLQQSVRLVALPSSEAVSQWYLECLQELDTAHVLAAIPSLRATTEGPIEGGRR